MPSRRSRQTRTSPLAPGEAARRFEDEVRPALGAQGLPAPPQLAEL